jgi:hypothetical protein
LKIVIVDHVVEVMFARRFAAAGIIAFTSSLLPFQIRPAMGELGRLANSGMLVMRRTSRMAAALSAAPAAAT